MTVGVVGPCGAGKSTLVAGLKKHGIQGKHIAQEHSYVPYMWKRITNPDVLVYLAVSYPVSRIRRTLNWNENEYEEQLRRLEHAREHADLVLDTNPLNEQEVLDKVLEYLSANINPEKVK
ncbi:MAG: hypothetical protein EHM41_14620 [Chloroflexi bacterium]|nr:MAG: hypothetical protein EHM41_14620 [Chloroflexota bacterium]